MTCAATYSPEFELDFHSQWPRYAGRGDRKLALQGGSICTGETEDETPILH